MEELRKLLNEIKPKVDFTKEKALLDDGILESFDVIQILSEIMETYGIQIDADDIIPENLNSLEQIYDMIQRKL